MPPISPSDMCVLCEAHFDQTLLPKQQRVVIKPQHVPMFAPRVVLLSAQCASNAFAKALLKRKPRELWIVGNSKTFAHHDHWFDKMCATHGVTHVPPQVQAPWCAVAETLSEALQATNNCTSLRILASFRTEKDQVMEFLRGSANTVRCNDPVFVWKERKRAIVTEIYGPNGQKLPEIDLDKAPASVRILTKSAGRVRPNELNTALVDTPRTFGASFPDCTLVLPNVSIDMARKAAQATKSVIIGIGRAPF